MVEIKCVEQDGNYECRISFDNVGELIFIPGEYGIDLTRLFVDPKFRKKGIARELINALENFARENGYNIITSPVNIQRDIVLYLDAFVFIECEDEDKIGIEQVRMNMTKEDNIKYDDGLIMMCKELR